MWNERLFMWDEVYCGTDLLVEEHIENNVVSLRLSVFKDYHWQGDCEIAPQLSNLTFIKKYNKINIEIKDKWFFIKKYRINDNENFSLYVDDKEKYIQIIKVTQGQINRYIYNLWEITE